MHYHRPLFAVVNMVSSWCCGDSQRHALATGLILLDGAFQFTGRGHKSRVSSIEGGGRALTMHYDAARQGVTVRATGPRVKTLAASDDVDLESRRCVDGQRLRRQRRWCQRKLPRSEAIAKIPQNGRPSHLGVEAPPKTYGVSSTNAANDCQGNRVAGDVA